MVEACQTGPDGGTLLSDGSLVAFYVLYNGILWQEICAGQINSDYGLPAWAPPGSGYGAPYWKQIEVCDDAATTDAPATDAATPG
jgi:hypothetical protein